MTDLIPTDKKGFCRDTHSKAIINTDMKALERHRKNKKQAKKLEELEKDVREIKDMLSMILKNLEK